MRQIEHLIKTINASDVKNRKIFDIRIMEDDGVYMLIIDGRQDCPIFNSWELAREFLSKIV